MLVKIKKLLIENDGYRRNVSLRDIYVNSGNIISISDYHGAENFLLRENSKFSKENFSLIRLEEGDRTQDIIAFGSAEEIYSSMTKHNGKQVLND